MTLPQFIINKIKPFADSFDQDLKSRLNAVDRELSAKGLIGSGVQIKRHQGELLNLLNELINKVAEIIFNDIKNKQLTKPEFYTLQADIEQLIKPLIDGFRNNFEKEVRRLIPKEESTSSVIADFDSDLQSQLAKHFVNIEQQFDALQ